MPKPPPHLKVRRAKAFIKDGVELFLKRCAECGKDIAGYFLSWLRSHKIVATSLVIVCVSGWWLYKLLDSDPNYVIGITQALLGSVGVVVGIVVALSSELVKRNWIPIVIGFLLWGGLGFRAGQVAVKRSNAAGVELRTSIDNLAMAEKRLTELQTETIRLQNKLVDSSAQNTSLAMQNLETATGGNSYCVVSARIDLPELTELPLLIRNSGSYSLNGVAITVALVSSISTDESSIGRSLAPLTTFEQSAYDEEQNNRQITVGTVGAKQKRQIDYKVSAPKPGVEDTYRIRIFQGNGAFTEFLSIARYRDGTKFEERELLLRARSQEVVGSWSDRYVKAGKQ